MTRSAALLTHWDYSDTAVAVDLACDIARHLGVAIAVSPEEPAKHNLTAGNGVRISEAAATSCDVVIALGGDGTTLRLARRSPELATRLRDQLRPAS